MSEQDEKETTMPPLPQVGDVYEIPVEGSLGLLALGATGLKLWREKRDSVKKAQAGKKSHE